VKIAEQGGIYQIGEQYVLCGDCVEILRSFPDNSIDSIVCDPPYNISFMSKSWDSDVVYDVWARECFRVLKHGGHIVAFGATRAIHRMVCALEDEGFEIRDMINWLYFSGFPKSMDISKQIDKMKGVDPIDTGVPDPNCKGRAKRTNEFVNGSNLEPNSRERNITKPATEEAQYWEGWGTALKPAQEPAILCRKPIEKGLNVTENVLKWGTGAINIDACRFGYGDPCWVGSQDKPSDVANPSFSNDSFLGEKKRDGSISSPHDLGRWPANIYQCAKPSRSERETGLDDLQSKKGHEAVHRKEGTAGLENPRAGAGRTASEVKNFHPTVKPTKLMAWLCRLLTPKGGIVLDTFLGSGTTGVSASMEGFKFIGTEMNPEYCDIAMQRIKHATGDDIMKVDAVIFEVKNV
jgi:site-specific DNA-methyltransferase (adenine-specific)